MKKYGLILLGIVCTVLGAAPAEVRTIHLRQDDAQVRYATRVYELRHADAQELLPFINSAVKRYSFNSEVRRVTTVDGKNGNAIMVSTGKDFLPMVDDLVRTIDRPGLEGTGIAHVAYAPKFRAARQFREIIDQSTGSSVGAAYVNAETNTIFWRDQMNAATRTLNFLARLDRPIPQISLRLNYYEIRDSDLKDWGFDYLAWKNGPGVNLLNAAYNAGHLSVDQVIQGLADTAINASTSWGFGGFFTAPQIDMSFIRCLQQSGNANVAANAGLTMINTPVRDETDYRSLLMLQTAKPDTAPFIYRISMYPEYQNIFKNTLGRTSVGKSYYEDEYGIKHADPPVLSATIFNPFICLGNNGRGNVLFSYSMNFKNVVERGNTGAELSNSSIMEGSATLAFGVEKVLTVYEKENDVEQTLGLPILCRIPVIKYLFSTVTTIRERTYIVVTAEAHPQDVNNSKPVDPASMTRDVRRRIENPFRKDLE